MPRTASSDIGSKVVGAAIRHARTKAGITQAELASRIGSHASYITNVEAGRVNVTLGQLAHIADALGAGLEISLPLLAEGPVMGTRTRLPHDGASRVTAAKESEERRSG